MITPTTFKIRFPEFATELDARILLLIEEAELFVTTAYGKYQDIATSYLTAHLLSVSNSTSSGNTNGLKNVASKSVEGVSVSYEASTDLNQNSSFFNTTSYGRYYLSIKAKLSVGNASLV